MATENVQIIHDEDTTVNLDSIKRASFWAFDTTKDHAIAYKNDASTLRHFIMGDSSNNVINTMGNMDFADTKYLGLGAAKGRIVFNDLATDTLVVSAAELHVANNKAYFYNVVANSKFAGLVLENTDQPATGEVGQSVSLRFDLQKSINSGGAFTSEPAVELIAGKDADYWHASDETDCDANFQIHVAVDGVLTEMARIDSVGRMGLGTNDPFLAPDSVTYFNGVGFHTKGVGVMRLVLEGNPPVLGLMDSGGAADDKIIELDVDGGIAFFQSRLDNTSGRINHIFVMDMGTGECGFGQDTILAQVHIGDSSVAPPAISADTQLVIEAHDATSPVYMTLLAPTNTDDFSQINFGRPSDEDHSYIRHDDSTDTFIFATNSIEYFRVGAGAVVVNNGAGDYNFTVKGDTDVELIATEATGANDYDNTVGMGTRGGALGAVAAYIAKLHVVSAGGANYPQLALSYDNNDGGNTGHTATFKVDSAGNLAIDAWSTTCTGEDISLNSLATGGNVGIGVAALAGAKLTVEGTIKMKEESAAGADTAAYGQLWVKDTSPNELWWTNDAGTDFQLISSTKKSVSAIRCNGAYGDYDVCTITTNGSSTFSFKVPDDFNTLVTLKIIAAPASGAEGSGKNIDLTSDYGGDGESTTVHSESDAASTYQVSATADVWGSLDISSVFTSLAAGDRCGVLVNHNTVGASIHYFCVEMIYT